MQMHKIDRPDYCGNLEWNGVFQFLINKLLINKKRFLTRENMFYAFSVFYSFPFFVASRNTVQHVNFNCIVCSYQKWKPPFDNIVREQQPTNFVRFRKKHQSRNGSKVASSDVTKALSVNKSYNPYDKNARSIPLIKKVLKNNLILKKNEKSFLDKYLLNK